MLEQGRPALSPEARRLHALSLVGQCVFFKHARPILDVLYGAESFPASEIPRISEQLAQAFLRGLPAAEDRRDP